MNTWSEVLAFYGVTLRRRGRELRGPCPLHRGGNPTAFAVTESIGFHCFACGAHGSLRTFVRLMERETGRACDLSPDTTADVSSPRPARVTALPVDAAHPYLLERGIHAATARFFGAGFYGGTGAFAGHVIVPLQSVDGCFVGYIGRRIDEGEPRYRLSAGIPRGSILFNLHRVRRTGVAEVIVTEGPLDAMAVHQAGFPGVTALLGCRATQAQLVALATFDRVRVLFDGDVPGSAGAQELAALLGSRATVVELPKADPCALKASVLVRTLGRRQP